MEKSKNRNPNTEELEKGFRTAFIDGEYNSNLAYRPEFLSNNAAEGKKVLSAIESELLRCDEFAISVAFITNSGIEPFMQTFKELERRNIPGRILTTNYLNFSDPKALRRLSKLQNLEIRMYVTDDESEGFHTKGYLFRKNITPVGKKAAMLSGMINFGNEIGMSDLVIKVDGKSYLKITLEVFPSKISYKEDYQAIVADVTAEVYKLVFDFLKKTYDSFDVSSKKQSSPVDFFAIIRKIYEEFLASADMVIAKPHHILETEHLVMPGHKIKRTDNRTLRWIEKHPDQTIRTNTGIAVNKALAVKKYVTYDTKENRLTKYMLQSTVKRLESFRRQYLKMSRETDLTMTDQIYAMIKGIQRRYNTVF